MLESTSLEFDTRHPQQLVVKILQVEFGYNFTDSAQKEIFRTAWAISMDLNYTFALLKQTTSTLAIACVELTHRLLGLASTAESAFASIDNDDPYSRFSSSRAAVSETMMDLLDLYTLNTNHRLSTFLLQLPSHFSLETIMDVRINLNDLAKQHKLPRYAHWREETDPSRFVTPPYVHALEKSSLSNQPNQSSDTRQASIGPGEVDEVERPKKAVAVRRFILQAAEAVKEVDELDRYFVTKDEEYDKEHEVEDGWETADDEDIGDDMIVGERNVKPVSSSKKRGFGKPKRR
jgi:CTD kinase subunit beta